VALGKRQLWVEIFAVIASYRDLKVWQEAMALAEGAYHLTTILPKTRADALAEQMCRSAISVPANIAEGYGRESTRSYIQFLRIARGSLNELETQILLAQRLRFVDFTQTAVLLASVEATSKMLNGLIRSLREKNRAPA
jgi:four helix bundle protein